MKKKPLSPERALNRAAALCSRSEQAPHDILTKLTGWGLDERQAEQVVQRLTELHFLDEQRYANAFVHDKFRFNGWGRLKIAFMLRQKHINPDIINEALAQLTAQECQNQLLELLQAKKRTLTGKEPAAMRASLLRFAALRGYEPDLCYACVSQVIDNKESEH